MFVHAEASNGAGGLPDLDAIPDGDLSIMMRIGSDFENNYYEYEIPLTMSKDPTLPILSNEYKEEVWKPQNNFDISINFHNCCTNINKFIK